MWQHKEWISFRRWVTWIDLILTILLIGKEIMTGLSCTRQWNQVHPPRVPETNIADLLTFSIEVFTFGTFKKVCVHVWLQARLRNEQDEEEEAEKGRHSSIHYHQGKLGTPACLIDLRVHGAYDGNAKDISVGSSRRWVRFESNNSKMSGNIWQLVCVIGTHHCFWDTNWGTCDRGPRGFVSDSLRCTLAWRTLEVSVIVEHCLFSQAKRTDARWTF